MTGVDDPREDLTPEEQRLAALLLLLRSHEPRTAGPSPEGVVRVVRVQLVVKDAVQAVATLAGAVADGVALLLGRGARSRGERR